MWQDNYKIWKMYSLCRDQVRLSGMGDLIGLDNNAVIKILELYGEGQKMFEDIQVLFNIEQEYKNENTHL